MTHVLRAVMLGVLACCWLAGTAGAARGTPGVTAKTVVIGGVLDQTGRGTIISKPILDGYELAIKEANAHGGVNGRKIEYIAASDNYDPSQTLPKLKSVVEESGAFAIMGVFGSDDANVAAPYLEERQIPFFDPIGGGVNITGNRWIWQTEPDYVREGRVMTDYVVRNLHVHRIGVLYQVGIGEGQVAAIKSQAAKLGAQVTSVASYEATDSNLSGQVLRLRTGNPDVVILNGTPTPTAAFVTYARLLGFKPADGFLANYPQGDPLWIALLGSSAQGNHVSSYADLTGRNPVAAAYRRAISKYGGQTYSNYGLYGYFNASLFIRALRLAGRNLTRTRLQSVLDTDFRHYSTGFTGKINWTPTERYGSRQFKIYLIQNGAFQPVTGWLNP